MENSHNSSPVVHFVDIISLALHKIGLTEEDVTTYLPVLTSLLILLVIITAGFVFKKGIEKDLENNKLEAIKPKAKFSLRSGIEAVLDFVFSLAKDNIGHGFERFLPLLSTLFIFILISNLLGLIPGFSSPTGNIAINLSMGLIVFLVYNLAGIKEHGFSYLKQFAGPAILIAPLFFLIELVSHSARPFSLSLRLMGNLFGDHTLLSVFTGLTYVGVPALLMFMGFLIACIQSFVFVLLTCIYISLALSHDH